MRLTRRHFMALTRGRRRGHGLFGPVAGIRCQFGHLGGPAAVAGADRLEGRARQGQCQAHGGAWLHLRCPVHQLVQLRPAVAAEIHRRRPVRYGAAGPCGSTWPSSAAERRPGRT